MSGDFDIRIWHFAIFREHRSNYVDDDLQFGVIRGRYINEDVSGIERNFAMFRVYDGGHRKNLIYGVVDNGIYW